MCEPLLSKSVDKGLLIFAKVFPAVMVNREDACIGERVCCRDGVFRIHGEMKRAAGLDARSASEENDGSDAEALGHFNDAFVPDCVAGDVDGTGGIA